MTPWLLLLLVGALLQSSWLSHLSLLGAHPNLLLVLVVGWTLLRGGREGLIWGLVGGLLLDLYSALPFGTFSVVMLVVALLTSLTRLLPFRPTWPLAILLAFGLSLLFHFLALILVQSLGWDVAWRARLLLLLPAATLDALLLALLFRPLRRLSAMAGEPAIDWSTR